MSEKCESSIMSQNCIQYVCFVAHETEIISISILQNLSRMHERIAAASCKQMNKSFRITFRVRDTSLHKDIATKRRIAFQIVTAHISNNFIYIHIFNNNGIKIIFLMRAS